MSAAPDDRPEPDAVEWHEDKAGKNIGREDEGRIPFDIAQGIFLDERRLDKIDARRHYGEERRNTIGSVDELIIHVTYTMRGAAARIISSRCAKSKERKSYGNRAQEPE